MSQKMTVRGKTYDGTVFKDTDFPINYDFDSSKGSHIDYKAFCQLINALNSKPQTTLAIGGCKFSKQILLFLLSFKECDGIIICECYNEEKQSSSYALCAVDSDGNPLGKSGDENKFVGGEWGETVSLERIQELVRKSPLDPQDKRNASFFELF